MTTTTTIAAAVAAMTKRKSVAEPKRNILYEKKASKMMTWKRQRKTNTHQGKNCCFFSLDFFFFATLCCYVFYCNLTSSRNPPNWIHTKCGNRRKKNSMLSRNLCVSRIVFLVYRFISVGFFCVYFTISLCILRWWWINELQQN